MMKNLKRLATGIVALLIIISVAGVLRVNNIKGSGKPVYEGEIIIPGLHDDVKVIRDQRGMPHIYAVDEHDLYMASGYVCAQERLWQMDLIRRATEGRLSEIFGDEYVETDLFFRSLGMSRKSELIISMSDSAIINCVQSYSDGVNYYIAQAGNNLPPEFKILRYKPEFWSARCVANIIGYMGWDLAGINLTSDLLNYRMINELGEDTSRLLIPWFDYNGPLVYPDCTLPLSTGDAVAHAVSAVEKTSSLGLATFSGSNNWVVSGELTTTGKPLLSNDMHLGLSSPGIWIQMHQVVPGKLNVTGVLIPGQPFVIAGHNENIAWGLTNMMVDDVDLYREKINEDGTKYYHDGCWKDLQVVEELINSRGEGKTEKIRYTHHGPLLSGRKKVEDVEISMRWSGFDMSNELKSVYLINRATDWNEFRNALSHFNAISQNFAYADIKGNIGLQSGGGVPVRERHGALIMPGDSSKYDWKGYVPHSMMPGSYNPESGRLSSANNRTVGMDFPFYIGSAFSMPYRINRIRDMLSEKDIFSPDDFKQMITDRYSGFAALLMPVLLDALSGEVPDGLYSEMKDELLGWDYNMAPDITAPAFFEYFVKQLHDELLADNIGDLYSEFTWLVKNYYLLMLINGHHNLYVDDINTDKVEDLPEILGRAFYSTVDILASEYGQDMTNWTWGRIHTFTIGHPLSSVDAIERIFNFNRGPYSVGGSWHTVSTYSYDRNFRVYHGASERHVYNLADWDESYTVLPTGISGVPSSEFYCSQSDTYCNDGFYRDYYTEKAVKGAASHILILKKKEND